MSKLGIFFSFLNLLLLALMLANSKYVIGITTSTFVLLIIFLFPLSIIVTGAAHSFKYYSKSNSNRSTFYNLLASFPLMNIALLILFAIATIFL